jgi:hypothetical protein
MIKECGHCTETSAGRCLFSFPFPPHRYKLSYALVKFMPDIISICRNISAMENSDILPHENQYLNKTNKNRILIRYLPGFAGWHRFRSYGVVTFKPDRIMVIIWRWHRRRLFTVAAKALVHRSSPCDIEAADRVFRAADFVKTEMEDLR